MTEIVSFADAAALRAHLDAINELGWDYRAVGIDAVNEPFLITLHGPYAETEQVFFVSPWDGEVDHGTGQKCDECCAANPHTIDQIRYPVEVLTRA